MRRLIVLLLLMNGARSFGAPLVISLGPNDGADLWLSSVYEYPGPEATRDHWGVNDEKLQVGGWGDEYRSLIRFPITEKMRSAESAKIRLYCFDRREFANDGGVPTPMSVFAIVSPWDEEIGWATQPSYEYLGMIAAPQFNTWCEIDITSTYNEWVEGKRANLGIALFPQQHGVAGGYPNFSVFRSSEFANSQFRPQLVIEPNGEAGTGQRRVVGGRSSSGKSPEPWTFDVGKFTITLPRWLGVFGPIIAIIIVLVTVGARAFSSGR